jgi:hypothetical protein
MKIGDLVETNNGQWYDIGIIIELFKGKSGCDPDPVRVQWSSGFQQWNTPRQIEVINETR